jgi:hypothetical protein
MGMSNALNWMNAQATVYQPDFDMAQLSIDYTEIPQASGKLYPEIA